MALANMAHAILTHGPTFIVKALRIFFICITSIVLKYYNFMEYFVDLLCATEMGTDPESGYIFWVWI